MDELTGLLRDVYRLTRDGFEYASIKKRSSDLDWSERQYFQGKADAHRVVMALFAQHPNILAGLAGEYR